MAKSMDSYSRIASVFDMSQAFHEKSKQELSRLKTKVAESLKDDIQRLLSDDMHSDLEITNGTDVIYTHKCILKTRSKHMWKDSWVTQSVKEDGREVSCIQVCGLNKKQMSDFVRQMYTVNDSVWVLQEHLHHFPGQVQAGAKVNRNVPVTDVQDGQVIARPEGEFMATQAIEVIATQANEVMVTQANEVMATQGSQAMATQGSQAMATQAKEVIVAQANEVTATHAKAAILTQDSQAMAKQESQVMATQATEVTATQGSKAMATQGSQAMATHPNVTATPNCCVIDPQPIQVSPAQPVLNTGSQLCGSAPISNCSQINVSSVMEVDRCNDDGQKVEHVAEQVKVGTKVAEQKDMQVVDKVAEEIAHQVVSKVVSGEENLNFMSQNGDLSLDHSCAHLTRALGQSVEVSECFLNQVVKTEIVNGKSLENFGTVIEDGAGNVGSEMFSSVKECEVDSGISEKMPSVMSMASENVLSMVYRVSENMPCVADMALENVPSVTNMASENVPSLVYMVSENMPGGADIAPENMPRVADMAPENMPSMADMALGNMPSVTNMAPETAPSVADNACETTPETLPYETCSPLGEALLQLYLQELNCDCCLAVDGIRFLVHKAILSARSEYFDAMLGGQWCESSMEVINLEGVTAEAVEQLLLFLYGGVTELVTPCDLMDLYVVADMYNIDSLKSVLAFYLRKDLCHFFHKPCHLCMNKAAEALNLCYSFNLEDLQPRVIKWIGKHFNKIWPTKSFALMPDKIHQLSLEGIKEQMTVKNVLDIIMECNKLSTSLPRIKWTESVLYLLTQLMDTAIEFTSTHFVQVIATQEFLQWAKVASWKASVLEEIFSSVIDSLPVDAACHIFQSLLNLEQFHSDSDNKDSDVVGLLQAMIKQCETFFRTHIHQVMRRKEWAELPKPVQARILEHSAYFCLGEVTQSKSKVQAKQRPLSSAPGKTQTKSSSSIKRAATLPRCQKVTKAGSEEKQTKKSQTSSAQASKNLLKFISGKKNSSQNNTRSLKQELRSSQNDARSSQNGARNSQNDASSSQNDARSSQNDARSSRNEAGSAIETVTLPVNIGSQSSLDDSTATGSCALSTSEDTKPEYRPTLDEPNDPASHGATGGADSHIRVRLSSSPGSHKQRLSTSPGQRESRIPLPTRSPKVKRHTSLITESRELRCSVEPDNASLTLDTAQSGDGFNGLDRQNNIDGQFLSQRSLSMDQSHHVPVYSTQRSEPAEYNYPLVTNSLTDGAATPDFSDVLVQQPVKMVKMSKPFTVGFYVPPE